MSIKKVNITEKLSLFNDYWNPRIVGELNGQYKSVEHKPVAENEVSVMLFEPNTTLNTGNTKGELTKENLEKI